MKQHDHHLLVQQTFELLTGLEPFVMKSLKQEPDGQALYTEMMSNQQQRMWCPPITYALLLALYSDYVKGRPATTQRSLAKRLSANPDRLEAIVSQLRKKLPLLEDLGLIERTVKKYAQNIDCQQIKATPRLIGIFEQFEKLIRRKTFQPAFACRKDGQIFLSRFSDGRQAPVHLRDTSLPDKCLACRTDSSAACAGVFEGFVYENRFYNRTAAARLKKRLDGPSDDAQ